MSYFEKYKRRMMADGQSSSDSYKNASRNLINQSFADSPTFAQIDIDGELTDVRVIHNANVANKMKLIFRPETIKDEGQIATIDNEKWMITEFHDGELSTKAEIQRINSSFKWLNSDGIEQEIPCILNSVEIDRQEGYYFYLADGEIISFVQYNDLSKTLLIDQKFVFGSSVYEIKSVDDFSKIRNDKGIIVIKLARTEKGDKDDMENRIADNSHLYSSDGGSSSGSDWLS